MNIDFKYLLSKIKVNPLQQRSLSSLKSASKDDSKSSQSDDLYNGMVVISGNKNPKNVPTIKRVSPTNAETARDIAALVNLYKIAKAKKEEEEAAAEAEKNKPTMTNQEMLETQNQIIEITKDYKDAVSNTILKYSYDNDENSTVTAPFAYECLSKENNNFKGEFRLVNSDGKVMIASADELPEGVTKMANNCYNATDGTNYVIVSKLNETDYFQNAIKEGTFTLQKASGTDDNKTWANVALEDLTNVKEVLYTEDDSLAQTTFEEKMSNYEDKLKEIQDLVVDYFDTEKLNEVVKNNKDAKENKIMQLEFKQDDETKTISKELNYELFKNTIEGYGTYRIVNDKGNVVVGTEADIPSTVSRNAQGEYMDDFGVKYVVNRDVFDTMKFQSGLKDGTFTIQRKTDSSTGITWVDVELSHFTTMKEVLYTDDDAMAEAEYEYEISKLTLDALNKYIEKNGTSDTSDTTDASTTTDTENTTTTTDTDNTADNEETDDTDETGDNTDTANNTDDTDDVEDVEITMTPAEMIEVKNQVNQITKEYLDKLSNRELKFVYEQNITVENGVTKYGTGKSKSLTYDLLIKEDKIPAAEYRLVTENGVVVVASADEIPTGSLKMEDNSYNAANGTKYIVDTKLNESFYLQDAIRNNNIIIQQSSNQNNEKTWSNVLWQGNNRFLDTLYEDDDAEAEAIYKEKIAKYENSLAQIKKFVSGRIDKDKLKEYEEEYNQKLQNTVYRYYYPSGEKSTDFDSSFLYQDNGYPGYLRILDKNGNALYRDELSIPSIVTQNAAGEYVDEDNTKYIVDSNILDRETFQNGIENGTYILQQRIVTNGVTTWVNKNISDFSEIKKVLYTEDDTLAASILDQHKEDMEMEILRKYAQDTNLDK